MWYSIFRRRGILRNHISGGYLAASHKLAVGKRTMKLQCDSIIQDHCQWMTADKHLRASDEHGQQWKFYLIKEPVTDEERVQ